MTWERWEGSPGCGKTRKLAEIVADAVGRYGEKGVVACSFSVAAAKVISSRVSLGEKQVGTLHSLCYRAMGEPGQPSPKVYVDAKEPPAPPWNGWITDRGHPDWVMRRGDSGGKNEGDRLLEMHGATRMRMEVPVHGSKPAAFAVLWEEWKAEAKCIDYTDMIEWAYQEQAVCPFNPKLLAVDECQDLTLLEWMLLWKWERATNLHLVTVGDAHQAVQGHLGAAPECFYMDRPGALPIQTLGQSYRVPRAVHTVAMSLMVRSRLPRVVYLPRPADGLVAKRHSLTMGMPRMWLPTVRVRVEEGQSVMLLASAKYFLHPVLDELKAMGLLFHNPYAPENPRWNPLGPSAGPLRAFLRPSGAHTATPMRWSYADVRAWTAPMRVQGVMTRGAKVDIETAAAAADEGLLRGDPDVTQLLEWFEPRWVERILDYDVRWWRTTFTAAWQKRQGLGYACDLVRKDAKALTREPLIVTGTINSVKGGEASCVYLSPSISPAAWEEHRRDKEAEVRRFYVGVTRAREELILMGGEAKAPKVWFW